MKVWNVRIICDGIASIEQDGKPVSLMMYNLKEFDLKSFMTAMKTPESRLPKMEYKIHMPEVEPPKKNKGTLGELLKGLPEDLKRRVQNVWLDADGAVSIDFAQEDGGTVNEDFGDRSSRER